MPVRECPLEGHNTTQHNTCEELLKRCTGNGLRVLRENGKNAGVRTRPADHRIRYACVLFGTWVAHEPWRHPVSHCSLLDLLSPSLSLPGPARYDEMARIGIIQCHPTILRLN